MKKILLLAGLACLFSLKANVAGARTYYQRNYQPASYTRTTQNRPTHNYQRQQYRQPSYYPQEAQPQPEPDYRYEQTQYAPYNTFRIRPVIGLDYVYSSADFDAADTPYGKLDLFEDKLNALAVSAGLQFNQYFGLEAFYQQSEKANKKTYVEDGYYEIEDQYKAYGLDLIAYYPVISQLDLIASLGVAYFKAEVKDIGSDDKIGFRAGAGLQYYITDYLAFRLMARYNYVNMDGLDNIVDVTAGIRVYF